MARFLSADWFADVAEVAEVAAATPPEAASGGQMAPGGEQLVLEQVVHGTPDGEVRYRVVARNRAARIEPVGVTSNGPSGAPDLTISCDWATAVAMAQGHLSAQGALMAGRLRVRGNLARLSGWAADLTGLDPVPPEVRRRTTY
jgi:hypothetical protein